MTNYEASVFLEDGRVELPRHEARRTVGAVA
jgi:hypothetical protein